MNTLFAQFDPYELFEDGKPMLAFGGLFALATLVAGEWVLRRALVFAPAFMAWR